MHLMRTFCYTKCYKCIWCQNAFDAKMHLMPKCIWCQNAFWQRNATQRTLCKNAFDAKMHLMRTFCYTKCYKCIWCQNAFWLCKNAFLHHIFQRKMFSNAYILRSKMFSITFYEVKCSASHFPKENVQHHILRSQMFSITFSKGKCSTSNVVFFAKQKTKHVNTIHNSSKNAFLLELWLCHQWKRKHHFDRWSWKFNLMKCFLFWLSKKYSTFSYK